jgi:hypothetical protein
MKLQTSGAVFRYWTTEMRSFGKVGVVPRAEGVRAFRGSFSIADMASAILVGAGADLL